MKSRSNKPLRNLGVYKLRDKKFVLYKRSNELSFLFSRENWNFRGPVDYRVSHGRIYWHGTPTGLVDEDLVDTGMTAKQPTPLMAVDRKSGADS